LNEGETAEESIMSVYFRLVIFTIACLGLIGLFAPMSKGAVTPNTKRTQRVHGVWE
jgi:hypothetical protein